jgi:hypothetical protein
VPSPFSTVASSVATSTTAAASHTTAVRTTAASAAVVTALHSSDASSSALRAKEARRSPCYSLPRVLPLALKSDKRALTAVNTRQRISSYAFRLH